MHLIFESLAGLRLGAPQVHLNLALIPLLSSLSVDFDRAPDYLLLVIYPVAHNDRRASLGSILTSHARARMQQRGTRPKALEALLDFGRARHLHDNGCEIVYFDKKARARLSRADPAAAREAEKLTRTYAIMGSNGVVITVGHRYRRVPWA